MRTPRSGRLGLLGVGAVFALVASALSPVTANAAGPTSSTSGLTMTKTWSGSVDNGGTAVARIAFNNSGAGNAVQNNVVVVDTFDPGLTFTGVVATNTGGTCALDNTPGFRRITCTGITIPAGSTARYVDLSFTGDYWGYATYTKNYPTDERLEIQKAETHVDVQSGEYETATVHCPGGYDLLDHSWHLQHVDQDTGDFYDVYVDESDVDNTSATVKLFNDAGGKAQGKLWALCLKNTTNHGHPVVWEAQDQYTETLTPMGPHERPFHAECPKFHTPMAINLTAAGNGLSDPDWEFQDDLISQTGLEADGSRRATVWAVVLDHAKVTLQWRCLDTRVSDHRMTFDVQEGDQNVPMHDKVAQEQITCEVGHKGVIGGWRGGHFNGSEPRPKIRNYWLWHDGPVAKDFEGKLLCLKSRLMRGGKIKKTGVFDDLHNHVFGTTQNHSFYIEDHGEDSISIEQKS